MPTKITKETHFQYLVRTVSQHVSNDCLIWPFNKAHGYGYVKLPGDPIQKRVHREAYRIVTGSYPVNDACHHCDTPSCYNPLHIFDGTDKENFADMIAKGRSLRGEKNCQAKHTEAVVREIRSKFADGTDRHALAEIYGMRLCTLNKIIYRATWKHV